MVKNRRELSQQQANRDAIARRAAVLAFGRMRELV
jgi:hypothetical protein